jgi:hypothetical protein
MDQETIDYIALQRLQSRYADIVNRRAWPELARIFAPDIRVTLDVRDRTIELNGPGEVGEFIGTSIAHMDLFEFVILNSVIDIDGDTATSRMFMWELRHDPTDGRTNAYGLYRDRYARLDGRWWFAGRTYCSIARTVAGTCTVFGLPEL